MFLSGPLLASCVSSARAQVQPPLIAGPVFEVASIRPSDPHKPTVQLQIGNGQLRVGDTVLGLVTLAYNVNRQMVEGAPSWIERESYDVVAKGDGSLGPDQIRLMLQALLTDRFRLRVRREFKAASGYILSSDTKKGAKLKESNTDTPRDGPGSIVARSSGLIARGATMKNLCEFLRLALLGRPVIDKTALSGKYDFELKYDDRELGRSATEGQPGTYSSIFSALGELGLKLTASKVSESILHIDNVERPTTN